MFFMAQTACRYGNISGQKKNIAPLEMEVSN